MSACLKYEPFALQPACVVLRFRDPPAAGDSRELTPGVVRERHRYVPVHKEDAERLKRAAQAFLLRIGS
jgi:hypothetical protein